MGITFTRERYDFTEGMKNKDLNEVEQGYQSMDSAIDNRYNLFLKIPQKLKDVFHGLTRFNKENMIQVVHHAIDDYVHKHRKKIKSIL